MKLNKYHDLMSEPFFGVPLINSLETILAWFTVMFASEKGYAAVLISSKLFLVESIKVLLKCTVSTFICSDDLLLCF